MHCKCVKLMFYCIPLLRRYSNTNDTWGESAATNSDSSAGFAEFANFANFDNKVRQPQTESWLRPTVCVARYCNWVRVPVTAQYCNDQCRVPVSVCVRVQITVHPERLLSACVRVCVSVDNCVPVCEWR